MILSDGYLKQRMWSVVLVTLTGLAFSPLASADSLTGRVVGFSDGDTITVLDAQQKTYRIRLSGIDAPEKAQPFGERAKQQLSAWVFQEEVQIIHDKTDRYGRVVGKVIKRDEDVNLRMVQVGYKAYEREQSAVDRVSYPLAEFTAKQKAIGLWSETSRVPPWEWRQQKRQT